MRLQELLKDAGIPGTLADPEITSLCHDSREAEPGSLFFAVPGANSNGREFIQAATERGAVAAMSPEPVDDAACPIVVAPEIRPAMARVSASFHGHPDRSLKCIAVTGTNGKTTVAHLVRHLLEAASLRCGMVGTIHHIIAGAEIPATRTTPEATTLQSLLAGQRDAGGNAIVMEASSHALVQHRLDSIEFDVAVFTNLTRDHLDYHGTMEKYFDAKSILFEKLANQARKKGRAVVNIDDRFGRRLVDRFAKTLRIVTCGQGVDADFRATAVRQEATGTSFTLEAKNRSFLVRMPLIGLFNVHNALAAIAAAASCGVDLRTLVAAMPSAPQVPGRLERVQAKRNFHVFIDYAHTPDALVNVLRTLRALAPTRLVVVFGCGGDRDRSKRPLMAAAASELADLAILTSDNPRSEAPSAIIEDMKPGLRGCPWEVVEDRREAIRRAIDLAEPGDIILVAGKGHEQYQEAAGVRTPFDDSTVAARAIHEKKGGA
jgi:UDP-N-acetylmuramoyl-L-alanyl-D-glutamate--2,6-diaminopimelate ligase